MGNFKLKINAIQCVNLKKENVTPWSQEIIICKWFYLFTQKQFNASLYHNKWLDLRGWVISCENQNDRHIYWHINITIKVLTIYNVLPYFFFIRTKVSHLQLSNDWPTGQLSTAYCSYTHFWAIKVLLISAWNIITAYILV